MNVFSHLVFRDRANSVSIKREGKTLRIVVEGSIGERVVVEVEQLRDEDLRVEGLPQ